MSAQPSLSLTVAVTETDVVVFATRVMLSSLLTFTAEIVGELFPPEETSVTLLVAVLAANVLCTAAIAVATKIPAINIFPMKAAKLFSLRI